MEQWSHGAVDRQPPPGPAILLYSVSRPMAIRTDKLRTREPFPAPPTPGIYKKIAYSFVALTIIIVFAALWFSSVRATVSVNVTREPTDIRTNVRVAMVPEQGELAGRVVQGVFERVQEFNVTGGAGTSVSGIATGKVRIYNERSSAQPLVVKTRLLTSDGRLYRLSEGVTVPPNGSVDAEAYSDEEGAKYDFSQKVSFTIPGLSESMQEFVYAESVTAFIGGEQVVRTLEAADVATAEESLKKDLLDEGKAKLQSEVGDMRYTDAVYLVSAEEKNTSVNLGEEAESFLMSLKLSITGVFYSKMDMESIVREQVADRVPEGREIVRQGPVKMQYNIENVDVPNEKAELSVNAEVLTKATSVDNLISKEAIIGLPIEEAESKIEQMAGIEEANITVRPSWVRRLPTLKDHITFKIE